MTHPLRAAVRRTLGFVVLSRHSALPELRRLVDGPPRSFVTQAVSLGLGSVLIGTAVALLVQADLGLAPYDVLSSGLADVVGLSLGQAGWLVAGVLFAVAATLGQRPSPWGIGYILANGVAVDATSHIINEPLTVGGRVGFLLGGIAVMAAGINLVLFSGTTGGPFELLMRAGEKRGVDPMVIRYALDGGVLVLGLLLGGTFGFGTIVYAALMGLVLRGVAQIFADHRTGRDLRLAEAADGERIEVGSGSLRT